MRRKAKVGTLVQTGLRLEAEILDRLRGGEGGLSDEIRRRLERTFAEDALDPAMRDLLERIASVSEYVRSQTGRNWNTDANAHEIFSRTIAVLMARLRPEGEGPDANWPRVRLIASDDPDTIAHGLEALEFDWHTRKGKGNE